jgi:hypothetical protein
VVFQASSRQDSRSHAATRVARRNTNRKHMTGDHHGQPAGKATLLVRAADEVIGTYSPPAVPPGVPGPSPEGRGGTGSRGRVTWSADRMSALLAGQLPLGAQRAGDLADPPPPVG